MPGSFTYTIKVNIEQATADTSTKGAGGSGGVDITKNIVRTVQQLQEEFRNLSSQVRSVATSLEQLRKTEGATSPKTGAPSGVSGTAKGPATEADKVLDAMLSALNEAAAASEKAAAASDKQAAASASATEAADKHADSMDASKASADAAQSSEQELSDMHAKAAAAMNQSAAASKAATDAEILLQKARRLVEGDQPRRNEKDRLNNTRKFRELVVPAANSSGVQDAAAKTIAEIESLIRIPPSATAGAKEAAQDFVNNIQAIISTINEKISSAATTGRDINIATGAIREQVKTARDSLGKTAPTADVDQIKVILSSKALAAALDRVNAQEEKLIQALEAGDANAIARSTKATRDAQSQAVTLTRGISKIFDTNRKTGRPGTGEGGAAIFQQLRNEGLTSVRTPDFDGAQRSAFKEFKTSVTSLTRPLKVVRRIVKALVDSGKGLGDIENTVRNFSDQLTGFAEQQSNFVDAEGNPSREQFINAREIAKELGRVKVGEQGQLAGPAGSIDRDSAILAGQRAVQQARADLAARAASAGPGQTSRPTESIDIDVPTASGGIRKIQVELQAFGRTVDSVKVKTKDLSDNMFDRTSVRAALQRVAVWSTAAGLVFGAFNALRQGITVLVDTESALIGLAKVMNESSVDLQAFKSDAQEAALAIANDFGQPLEQVLETMILFGQQGKSLRETIQLSKAAALASSVTTLDQPEAASALTAATQQFGLAFSDAESIVDKFNEVSNNAAVTETDLAQALKKAGQAAKNAGLDLDDFNGVVAAISEQTRQSGNEIGTALRFIFARLQTPEAEKGLAQVGISARDAAGNIKGFTPIVEELAAKFDTLTNSQKTQVAISIAGTRRFNTLLALLDNFTRFQDAAANSANSAGSAFREQEKITETAAFKIERLKNSLKELALSFGSSLLDPLKLTVDILGKLAGALTVIPGFMKTTGAAVAIGSLAFLKFNDHISSFLGLAGSIKSASSVIGGSLRTNLTQGLSRETQLSRFGADTFDTATLGVSAARSSPDFGALFGKSKGAATAFSKELTKANFLLVDQRGQVIKNSAAFGKFGATIRGFGVKSTEGLGTSALALGGLNSGISRLIGLFGIMSSKIVSIIPGVSRAFEGLDAAAASTNRNFLGLKNSTLALVGTFGRFAIAGAAIYAIVAALSALKDVAFESAEEVESGLQSEIEKRQQAVSLLANQEQKVKALADARRRAASISSPGAFDQLSPAQEQDSLAGRFKSTAVALKRIREQEQEASNAIGFANPELIDSIDSFGNVVLSSADSFDVLAEAAGNAQEVLLGLTQIKVIGGFNDELKASNGIIKDTVGGIVSFVDDALGVFRLGGLIPDDTFKNVRQRFDRSLAEFKDVLDDPVLKQARDLGVPVSAISPEKAASLGKAGGKFQRESLDVRRVVETARDKIKGLSSDSSQLIFESLAADAKDVFKAQADLLSTQGIETDAKGLLNQAFLQNRGSLAPIKGNIGATAELTAGQLRESGRPPEVLSIFDKEGTKKDVAEIREEILKLSGGELILFEDLRGIPQQAVVRVTATGKRQIKFISDQFGTIATESLEGALTESFGNVQIIDSEKIKSQLTSALQEIGRIISGAGRGGLLTKDLELGVDFRSDLSSQQRASQGNEVLFSDLQKAQEQLASFREGFGANAKEGKEGTSKITDPENVAAVKEMARAIDELATAAKLSVELEKVGIAFEKAVEKIKNSRIEEVVAAEFSGAIGATTGALKRAFDTPKLQQDLSDSAITDSQSQGIITLANELSRAQQANGDLITGLRVAERNIGTFVRDFQGAGLSGGASDPNRISDLARRSASLSDSGLDKAQAILTSINAEQLTAQEKTNEILNHINANLSDDPRLIGAALAQAAVAAKGDTSDTQAVAAALEAQSAGVSGFTSQDMRTILTTIPATLIPKVVEEFRASQSRGASGSLLTKLISVTAGSRSRETLADKVLRATEDSPGGETIRKILSEQGIERDINAGRVPPEVIKLATTALQSALASSFSDEQFSKILANPDRIGDVELDAGKISGVLIKAVEALEGSDNTAAKSAAVALRETISQGGAERDRLLASVHTAILQTVDVGSSAPLPTVEVEKSLEQTRVEAEKLAAALEATARANDAILKPLRDITGAFFVFKEAITDVTTSIRSAAQKAADDILIGRDTSQFTTPQVGLLSGVSLPTNAPDQRRRISQLTGSELTALESPQLSGGINEVGVAFEALVEQLSVVKQAQLKAQRDLEGFQSSGNTRGIKLAQEALTQLGGISSLVEGQINSAQGTLKEFGESFRDIESINQLRVDIENLVQAFDKEISLKFDRTSIQTALGNTLFSATRPTFEQFEQGQSGFLTKFERSLASIDFQESAGTITRKEASRSRDEVDFNRDEEVIALAQSKENEKLQSAVGAAEQVRSRLFDFVQTGAPGTEAAQALLSQITSELETAGDILPGGFGRSSIRDPRTGQQVDVPASSVNSFRGLPGLSNITQQLTKLSQDATRSTAQQNADLITQPLLTVLDQIPTKLDDVVSALKDAASLDNPEASADLVSGTLDVQKVLSRILAPFQRDGAISAGDVSGIVEGLNTLSSSISPDTLAKLLQTSQVSPGGSGTEQSLETFLRETLPNRASSADPTQRGSVQASINTVFDTANKSLVQRFELLDAPLGAVAEGSAATSEGLLQVTTAAGDTASELVAVTEALASFKDALSGGVISAFEAIADKFKGLLGQGDTGGGVQALAQGGLVFGPGGPTEDKVPLLASPGEFVVKASAVKNIGVDNLKRLNSSSSSLGPDSRASGATNGFAEGGLVDVNAAFARQRKELAASKVRAAEEKKRKEDNDPAILRERLLGLQSKQALFLGESPPDKLGASMAQEEIDQLTTKIAAAEKKAAADRARLQELREKGFRQQQVVDGVGGDIIVPDAAVVTKSKRQRLQEERTRRDTLSKRRGTIQLTSEDHEGLSFARVLADGTYSLEGNASNGAVPVSDLVGVSTNDPQEFKAEVARRAAFSDDIRGADKKRGTEVAALRAEFAELLEKEAKQGNQQQQGAEYAEALESLKSSLRNKSSAQLETMAKEASRIQGGITTADSLLSGKGDFGRDDFILQAEDLDAAALDFQATLSFLQESKTSPLALRGPPTFSEDQFSGISVRSAKNGASIGISKNLDGSFVPNAFGQFVLSSPSTDEFIESLLESGLVSASNTKASELRKGARFSGFRSRESLVAKGAEEIQGLRSILPDGALGGSLNLALLMAQTAVTGVDTVTGAPIGLVGDLISPERNEVLADGSSLIKRASNASFEDALSLVSSPFNQIAEDFDTLSNLKIELEYAKNEGDKRRLKTEIADAESRTANGLFNLYLGGRAGVSVLSKAKKFVAPKVEKLGLTKRARARNQASKITDSDVARDIGKVSQQGAMRATGAKRRALQTSADAHNRQSAKLQESEGRKVLRQQAKSAAHEAGRAKADANAARILQNSTGVGFSRNLRGVTPSKAPTPIRTFGKDFAKGFGAVPLALASPLLAIPPALRKAETRIGSSKLGTKVKDNFGAVKSRVVGEIDARRQKAKIEAEDRAELVDEGLLPPPKPTLRERSAARAENKRAQKKLDESSKAGVEAVLDTQEGAPFLDRLFPSRRRKSSVPPKEANRKPKGTGRRITEFLARGGLGTTTSAVLLEALGVASTANPFGSLTSALAIGGTFAAGAFAPSLFKFIKGKFSRRGKEGLPDLPGAAVKGERKFASGIDDKLTLDDKLNNLEASAAAEAFKSPTQRILREIPEADTVKFDSPQLLEKFSPAFLDQGFPGASVKNRLPPIRKQQLQLPERAQSVLEREAPRNNPFPTDADAAAGFGLSKKRLQAIRNSQTTTKGVRSRALPKEDLLSNKSLLDDLRAATGGLGSGFGSVGPLVEVLGRRAFSGVKSLAGRAGDFIRSRRRGGSGGSGGGLPPVDDLTGKVLPQDPVFFGPTRGRQSVSLGGTFEEKAAALRKANKEGLTLEDITSRKLEPELPEKFQFGIEGDRAQVVARIENVLKAPVNSLQDVLGPNAILKFLDTSLDEALNLSTSPGGTGAGRSAALKLRASRGGSNITQLIDELGPVVDQFKRGTPLPDVLDVADVLKGPKRVQGITPFSQARGLDDVLKPRLGDLTGLQKRNLLELDQPRKFGDLSKGLTSGELEFDPRTRQLVEKGKLRTREKRERVAALKERREAKKARDVAPLLAEDDISKFTKFADGGKISGPGGPTSDRIPILTSPGEFVLNANAVGQIGLPVIESMNRTGILPKFQHGGPIGDDELLAASSQLRPSSSVFKTLGQVLQQGGGALPSSSIDVISALSSHDTDGFRRVEANNDLRILRDLVDGKKVYTHKITGESVTASDILAGDLLDKGFELDRRPWSEYVNGTLLEGANGALTLLAPGESGIVAPRGAAELRELEASGLKSQRVANASFQEGVDRALLASQGRTEFSTALPGSTGSGARLRAAVDEAELEGFRRGGLLSGSGGPHSDDIPILASSGEFILNADAAGKLGLPVLEQLNSTGKLPGFQNGGDVSGRSSESITVNTEEIASAIRIAFAQAAEAATITIDAEAAASSVSTAISTALSNVSFPAVKLDTGSVNLGDSLGAGLRDRLELAEGSISILKESTSNLLEGLGDINEIKISLAEQEDVILNKVEFRLNKEKSIDSAAVSSSTAVLDNEIKVIRAEMQRIEGDLKQAAVQASLALSKAQAK